LNAGAITVQADTVTTRLQGQTILLTQVYYYYHPVTVTKSKLL